MAEGNCSTGAPSCRIPVSCIRSLYDGVNPSRLSDKPGRLTEAQVSAVDDPPAYETTHGR